MKLYVPRDSAARSVGADEVAERLAALVPDAEIVRTGSRGMLWLEPLVEVELAGGAGALGRAPSSAPDGDTAGGAGALGRAPDGNIAGRVGYGPVRPEDVDGLVAAGMLDGAPHELGHGPVEELPWMRGQQRVTFARVGVTDPLSARAYTEHGGMAGLRRALEMTPAEVVAEVTESGLRGRGGAGFPTGIKWKTVLGAAADQKYVCCNADEGDSGTFADRMLIEGDPFALIEGMTIAGYAVGATEGYVYVRSEYPDAVATLRSAIEIGYAHGWLGERVLGSDARFDLHVRVGAGAYICGEETSMLESLEGKRGMVRPKPPIPALEGLFGRPTVVNNVLSLASVPAIMADGAAAFAALGVGRSRGTQVFQLGGNVARGGVVETAFGVTLGELVDTFGGGTASGRPVRAVQVGGPLGAYLPPAQFGLPMDYEAFAEAGAMVGHGGIVVFDDSVDMAAMARFAFEFCAEESCGRCTPCRVGAVRGVETIDRIRSGGNDADRKKNLVLLDDLCELMTDGSLCAMGGLTPMPVRSAVRHFAEDFAGAGLGADPVAGLGGTVQ
ncbi:NADH-quinone oxidoreductase subunit NuoF [Pseudonocardia eucalypti]|uniref:NADH-quinone oxidoreductase subunit NuoF n=1 Tax=Pseudonocardia eucalypti TaxID=648755 RepID=A0ABP9R964_9PSEU|nr:formate dehydrogenase iron-sulfur subunit [Pseudonocardia eucalypti]